jgi:hypothetical protein
MADKSSMKLRMISREPNLKCVREKGKAIIQVPLSQVVNSEIKNWEGLLDTNKNKK